MNKQLALAGLLGAAAAQTPCDDAFVAEATEAVAEVTATLALATAATAALEAAAADELTAFNTAQGRVTTQAGLIAPFDTA